MKRFLVVTPDQWSALQRSWSVVSQRTRLWHWKLDRALPGRLGQIGDWLNKSEVALETDSGMIDHPATSLADVRKKIEEYRVNFHSEL